MLVKGASSMSVQTPSSQRCIFQPVTMSSTITGTTRRSRPRLNPSPMSPSYFLFIFSTISQRLPLIFLLGMAVLHWLCCKDNKTNHCRPIKYELLFSVAVAAAVCLLMNGWACGEVFLCFFEWVIIIWYFN